MPKLSSSEAAKLKGVFSARLMVVGAIKTKR
jgi:hypothetical protein